MVDPLAHIYCKKKRFRKLLRTRTGTKKCDKFSSEVQIVIKDICLIVAVGVLTIK